MNRSQGCGSGDKGLREWEGSSTSWWEYGSSDAIRFRVCKHQGWKRSVHGEAQTYRGLVGVQHETVKHADSVYLNCQMYTNGVESFWAVLKWAYRHMSPKHSDRYATQFPGEHNLRNIDTLAQMQHVVTGLVSRHTSNVE